MITDREWDSISSLIDEGWHGEFDRASALVWRPVLDGFGAAAVMSGLGVLIHRGGAHRPSIGELVAAIRSDSSVPTFDELVSLVYGRGGVLKARPPYVGPVRDPDKVRHDMALARAREMHPLVYAFVSAPRRLEWLRLLEIDDPDDGHFRRKELAEAWARHLEASEGRELAALASGRGPGELRRLDPLAAVMGAAPSDRRELEQGDRTC